MGLVQVIIDDSTSKVITGEFEFDRDNGGTLIVPSGTSFPGTPVAKELFWRSDEAKLYRRNDGDTAWVAVTAAVTVHATTHEPGGSDTMAVDAAGATGSLRTLGTSATSACAGNDARLSDARTPTAHATTHNVGGSDVLAIDAAAGTGSLRTLGTSATSACAGNDSRLSDTRTPTAHAASHQSGGSDALKLDDLSAPDDNTDLNATTGQHGLLPKLGGGTTNFLRADGTWATPPGGTASPPEYFDAYDAAGGTDISSGWTDVPLDTERKKDSSYTHTGSSAEVTVTATDVYVVALRVSTDVTSGTSRSDAECRLMIDTGSGYGAVPGTIGATYARQLSQGKGTATVLAVLSLTNGDKIKGQAQLFSGGNTINLLAEGSSLTIMRLRGQKGDTGPAGSGTTLTMQDDGTPLTNTPHSTLNVTGDGATFVDAGSGVATLNVPGSSPPPENRAIDFADFINIVDYGWGTGVSGTGTAAVVSGAIGGQIELGSGATSGGAVAVQQDLPTLTTASKFELKGRIRLLDTADIYVEMGVQDSGHYALFSNDGTAGAWRVRNSAGGSETSTDSVDTRDTSWHTWEIVCSGTQIVFKIDDVTVATHSTNLPTNAMYGYVYLASQAAGNKRCRVDYLKTTTDREA